MLWKYVNVQTEFVQFTILSSTSFLSFYLYHAVTVFSVIAIGSVDQFGKIPGLSQIRI